MPSTKYAIEQRAFALKKEAVRGVAETAPDKWYPVMKESELDYKLVLLDDDAVRGISETFPNIPGRKRGAGKIRLPLDAQTIGEFLHSLLGTVTSAPVTSEFIVTATNKFIDFNIGGVELHATIPEMTYVIGAMDSDVGSLCAAIKAALSAAEATKTYTVSVNTVTKKLTIYSTATTFQLLWKSGVHGSDNTNDNIGFLLGYDTTANDIGATSYTADSGKAGAVHQHTFLPDSTEMQRPSYSMFLDRGMNEKVYNLCVVKKLHLVAPVDGLLMVENEILLKSEADGDLGTPVYPEQHYLSFQNSCIYIGGVEVANVKNYTLEIDNMSAPLETLNCTAEIDDILVRGKLKINGQMTVFFETEEERQKFLSATFTDIRFHIHGALIDSTSPYTVEIILPKIGYTAYPYDDEDGLLASKVTFEGYYHSGVGYSIKVNVINQDAAY